MVQHCEENNLLLAVCHVDKVLHKPKPDQDIEDALQTNQTTYKPVSIVSAGPCQIMKTLDDGRLMVNVTLEQRFHLVQERQSLPFAIYEADELTDEPQSEAEQAMTLELKDKLLHRLLALTAHQPQIQAMLMSDEWKQKSPSLFSFEIFNILQTDADIMQQILETQSPVTRLKTALEFLKDVPAQL
jgi:Lon protease-like protein